MALVTGSHTPEFEIGITKGQAFDGKVYDAAIPYIKVSIAFRPYLGKLSGNQMKTLFSIGLRMNEEYEAWPSLRTIAEECGFAKSTADRMVDQLAEMDLIEVIPGKRGGQGRGRKNQGNRYRIKMHFGVFESDPVSVPPAGHLSESVPKTGSKVSRLNGTELEPLNKNHNEIDNLTPKIKMMTDAGVWESEAKRLAPSFSLEEIEAALQQADPAKFDGKRGGVVRSILRRWLESPKDREREAVDPYQAGGPFWDS